MMLYRWQAFRSSSFLKAYRSYKVNTTSKYTERKMGWTVFFFILEQLWNVQTWTIYIEHVTLDL